MEHFLHRALKWRLCVPFPLDSHLLIPFLQIKWYRELFTNLILKYMYVIKRQVSSHRAIAMLVATALVLWATGAHMFVRDAVAANITFVKDTRPVTEKSPLNATASSIAQSTRRSNVPLEAGMQREQ